MNPFLDGDAAAWQCLFRRPGDDPQRTRDAFKAQHRIWTTDHTGIAFPCEPRPDCRVSVSCGVLHNLPDDTEPAFVAIEGHECFLQDGKLHRDGDRPAVIDDDNGDELYYKNGELSRDDGRPCVVLTLSTRYS